MNDYRKEEGQLETEDETATPGKAEAETSVEGAVVAAAKEVAIESLITRKNASKVEAESDLDKHLSDDTIFHVDGLNNCPFRLAHSKQCKLPRGTVGAELGTCIPPNPEKNTVPENCPLLTSDYLVSLIVD